MDFYEVLDQVINLVKERGRASYRALKVQFKLDDASLEALKEEMLYVHSADVKDDGGRGFIWTGETEGVPEPTAQSDRTTQPDTQEVQPTQVTSPLVESRAPDAAERRQLTVMFCDLVGSTSLSGQLDPEDLHVDGGASIMDSVFPLNMQQG